MMYDHGDDDDNTGDDNADGEARKKCKLHAKPIVPSKCAVVS